MLLNKLVQQGLLGGRISMLISIKVSEDSLTELQPGDPGAQICPQNHAHLCKNLRNVAEHAHRPQQLRLFPSFLLFNSSHTLRLDFLLLVEAAGGPFRQNGLKRAWRHDFRCREGFICSSTAKQNVPNMCKLVRFTLIAHPSIILPA